MKEAGSANSPQAYNLEKNYIFKRTPVELTRLMGCFLGFQVYSHARHTNTQILQTTGKGQTLCNSHLPNHS